MALALMIWPVKAMTMPWRHSLLPLVGRSRMSDADADADADDGLRAGWIESPLGALLAVADDTHLHAIRFQERDKPPLLDEMERLSGAPVRFGRTPAIDLAEVELAEYFAGRLTLFTVPLATRGTDFERRVWDALLAIPVGETRSYGDIARAIGQPSAFRAVAQANNVNRHAIIIPCHRVIGSDGSLVGYGSGIERKRWLLRHEGRMCPVGLFAEGM
jgi:AraC family transcriptional regulator of adaptative response/methylated-DNA-[protein]-cysteine methyltransferase